MKIPSQIEQERFCRVKFKEKVCFEKAWTMLEDEHLKDEEGNWYNEETENYVFVMRNKEKVKYNGEIHNYSDKEIQKHLPMENYGVLTGLMGYDETYPYMDYRIGVLDDDTEDKILIKLALESFGETFRVRDHLYFKIRHWNGKCIKFWKNGDSSKKENHLGEMQGKGQMVVSAGSTHPSGEKYEVVNNVPMVEVELDTINCFFKDYIQKQKKKEKRIAKSFNKSDVKYGSGFYEEVSDIPITSVIPEDQDECLQLGAETPPNFRVYDNYFRCFHCNSWGGVWLAIAVKHNIIGCSEAQGKNSLSKSQADEVVKIAQEDYGLKKVESTKKPRGWACSINIRKLAERYNIMNCPKCDIPFNFNERLGFFKCSSCGDFGGLKTFAMLCHKKKLGVLKNEN